MDTRHAARLLEHASALLKGLHQQGWQDADIHLYGTDTPLEAEVVLGPGSHDTVTIRMGYEGSSIELGGSPMRSLPATLRAIGSPE